MKNSAKKPDGSSRNTALVTGAGSGLGKFLALECAKNKYDLLLVDLPGSDLQNVRSILVSSYNIRADVIETDLSSETNIRSIRQYCTLNRIKVSFLINNAGIGFESSFNMLTASFCSKLIDVNIKAAVLLTKLFLEDLKNHENGYILNISSLASFTSMPYKSIYAASKAFVRCFSTALRTELEGHNVHVTSICPGPIATSDMMVKRINSHGLLSRLAAFDPAAIAKLAIHRSLKGGSTLIPGLINRIQWFLMNILPERTQQFILKRQYSSVTTGTDQKEKARLKAA